ncbi:MAG: GntR family transcriptional regulator [bacterium]
MFILIDTASGLPIYLQIINQIKYSIAMEAIKSGDQLPSVRELASQLRVNPNTVAKAYTELERDGIVFTKRGEGTFVSDIGVALSEEEKNRIIAEMLNRTLVQAYHLNLTADRVKDIFNNEIEKIKI